jgi:alpha-L-fucosidase
MLGSKGKIRWNETENGLEVNFPKEKPCDYAYVLRIVPKGDLLFE